MGWKARFGAGRHFTNCFGQRWITSSVVREGTPPLPQSEVNTAQFTVENWKYLKFLRFMVRAGSARRWISCRIATQENTFDGKIIAGELFYLH
jgi:hypothetical protein